jgi:hypothetical protein
MDFIAWKNNILETMKDISDKEYQEESWFGKSDKYCSSAIELTCQLLDDFMLEDFINHPFLGTNQREALIYFKEIFEDYISDNNLEDDQKVFHDPEWNNIRLKAKEVLHELVK